MLGALSVYCLGDFDEFDERAIGGERKGEGSGAEIGSAIEVICPCYHPI